MQPIPRIRLHFLAVADQHIVNGTLPHHQAQGGLGAVFQRAPVGAAFGNAAPHFAGVVHIEQEIVQIADAVLHHHLHIHNVEVAGNHQRLLRERRRGAGLAGTKAQLHPARFGD